MSWNPGFCEVFAGFRPCPVNNYGTSGHRLVGLCLNTDGSEPSRNPIIIILGKFRDAAIVLSSGSSRV